jgi:uncharacterized membrane protein
MRSSDPSHSLDFGHSSLQLDGEVNSPAMEVDLKQLLDTIREENASSHAETRQQFVAVAEGIRREFAEVELKQALDTIREENTSSHAETRRQVVVVAEGTRHEFVVVADGIRREFVVVADGLRHEFVVITEGLRHEIQTVAEGVTVMNERLERIDAKNDGIASDHDARITRLEADASRRSR